MYYYPKPGEFTMVGEVDVFSIEIDGVVSVGNVKIRPVNDAPAPVEPGVLNFPRFGETAVLANKLTNWTFENVANNPAFGAKYYYRGNLGPQKDSDGDTLRYLITRKPTMGELRLLCTGIDPKSCGADNSAFEYVPFGNNSGGLPDYFEFSADDSPGGGHNNYPTRGPVMVTGNLSLFYNQSATMAVNDATAFPYVAHDASKPYLTDEDTTTVVRLDRSGTDSTLAGVERFFRVYVSQDVIADAVGITEGAVVDAEQGTLKLAYGTLAFKCFDDQCEEPPCAAEVGPPRGKRIRFVRVAHICFIIISLPLYQRR